MINLIAELADVPASLVMRTNAPSHAVLVSNDTDDNAFPPGREYRLHERLYCYGVLKNDAELVVEDAPCDPDWSDNEDLREGFSFYIGYPLKWPDGQVFGTICVLDRHRNRQALKFREGLGQFARVIETDLALLDEIAEKNRLQAALNRTLGELEKRVFERTRELEEANTALRVLLNKMEETRRLRDEEISRQINGLVLPHLTRLRHGIGSAEPHRSQLSMVEKNLRTVTEELSSRLVQTFASLTPTEVGIAQMIMDGRTTKDIAVAISRETSTVDFHRNNIRRKLGISSRRQSLRTYLLSMQ